MDYKYILTLSHDWPIYAIIPLFAVIFIMVFYIRKQRKLIKEQKRLITGYKRAFKFKDCLTKSLVKQCEIDSAIIAKNMTKIVDLQINNAVLEEKLDLLKFDYDLLKAKIDHKKRPVKTEQTDTTWITNQKQH